MSAARNGARPRPYVSVSGVTSPKEVHQVMALFDQALLDVDVREEVPADLALGVLASEKTLRGIGNRHPRRYPPREQIVAILTTASRPRAGDRVYRERGMPTARPLAGVCACGRPSSVVSGWCGVPCPFVTENPRVRTFLHVATDATEGGSLREVFRLVMDVLDATFRTDLPTGVSVLGDGIQINATWPDAFVIDDALARMSYGGVVPDDFRVVLQVGPRALQEIRWNDRPIDRILDRVAPYVVHGTVTDVLFDWSGGRGVDVQSAPFGVEVVEAIVRELLVRFPSLGVGVAGGISRANVARHAAILRSVDRGGLGVSVDAESALRVPSADGGDLAPPEVEGYLREALRAIVGDRP